MTTVETIATDIANPAAGDGTLFHSLLEAAREGILLIDPSTRIVATNDAIRRVFARGTEPIEGRRLTEIIRDADLHAAIRGTLSGAKVADIRLHIVGSESRVFDVRVSPIEYAGGRHAIAVFYDLTQIEKLERVRQEFLSNISHELRTPLTSILAYVETLEDGAIDDAENGRRFLSVIRRNAERMKALIDDILELSMIESGQVTINKRPVRLKQTVDEIFASLSSKASERNISLQNSVGPDAAVLADPARLEQMLTNLVDNAIKFNRRAGRVEVFFVAGADTTRILIRDTGEGILPEHLPRIFERFYRADRSRAREVGGTGLGLAIVKHLARLHDGEVTLRSRLTEGTEFTIELPLTSQ